MIGTSLQGLSLWIQALRIPALLSLRKEERDLEGHL